MKKCLPLSTRGDGRVGRLRIFLEAAHDSGVRVVSGQVLGLELAFLELIVEAVGIVDDVISAGPAVLGLVFSLLVVVRYGVKWP
jgi:hypothetical protein